MGRWSHSVFYSGLLFAVGCTTPALKSTPDIPSMTDRVVPEITSQATVAKDPELVPDKAAKLCLATAEELEKNGHLEQAIGQYELCLKHIPRQPAVSKKLAACYAKATQFDKSIVQYQLCLQASPKDADLLNDLGYTYYEKEDFVTAEKYLRQAIVSKPDHQRAHGNLGLALGRQQKWKESLAEFKKAGSPAVAQANLAAMYLAAGQHDEARKSCNIALGLDPQLKSARELLAKLEEKPKEENKTIAKAEARLLSENASQSEIMQAQASQPKDKDSMGDSLDAGAIQLRRPVRVNRQTPSNEFKPVRP